MAPVHQRRQLDALGPPQGEQRVDGGPDGAAGVNHVVHQDDALAGDVKGQVGAVLPGVLPVVVPEPADVQGPPGNVGALHRGHASGDAPG